jgi:serine/threonine protein kinase
MMTQQNPLERYEILNELGRGAIGRVYAARDRSTGAVVVLKTLDPALFSEPDANIAGLFLEYARSAARLRHRNIVRVHDAGEAGGTAYAAMELVEGESLRDMLDDRPLSIARAIQIFDDIASALAYAHEEGVVHRGVKPSNIIVLPSGVAKIGDFGIGQLREAALLSGQQGGCLSYLSPEQLRGDPVDHRCDLFSLGAVFYEMLTRRVPFEGNSPKQITQNIRHAEPPLPSKVNPHVPFALDRIVFSMLAEHPDDRFANARLLLRDLQRLEEELGLGPGASAGTGEPTASVQPGAPEPKLPPQPATEPKLRTPDPNRFREPEVPHATRIPPRGQTEPAAPQPATKHEPTLRTLDLDRFRDPAQMRDAPRFAALDDHDARFMMDRERAPQRSSGSRAASFAALALMIAVMAAAYIAFLRYAPAPGEARAPASRMQQAPAIAAAPSRSTAPAPMAEAPREPSVAPAAPEAPPPRATGDATAKQESKAPRESSVIVPVPSRSTAPPPVAEATPEPATAKQESSGIASAPNPLPPKPLVAEPGPPAQAESLLARESKQPATAGTAPKQETPRLHPTAKTPDPQPGGMATLIIAVSPQGELYIDGKHYGTTPPLTTLDLEPGMRRIEIRSGSRKPYLTYMAVEPGDQRRIRHDFSAKPSRPPR